MLHAALWPTLSDIYKPTRDSQNQIMTAETLLAQARVLQLALQMAHSDGRFSRLATVLAAGQAGMEDSVCTDFHGDGHF